MSAGCRASVADGIGHVILDHPPLNILTRAVLATLRETVGALDRDPDVRVVLLSAAGKHFSAGADVAEHMPPAYETLIPEFLETVRLVRGADVPVVAAVQGRCLGAGFELALAADLIVAGEDAVLGQPEIQLGVLPPAACALLPLRCAWGTAVELVLGGDPMSAAEGHRVGLVQRVVPNDRVVEDARALAERLSRHSGAILRLGKKALMEAATGGVVWGLERASDIYLDGVMATEDALEGLQAFQDKRPATWRHR